MSDLMFHDDEEAQRAHDRMRRDYASWQKRPSIVDWFLVASLVGVLSIAAILAWAAT